MKINIDFTKLTKIEFNLKLNSRLNDETIHDYRVCIYSNNTQSKIIGKHDEILEIHISHGKIQKNGTYHSYPSIYALCTRPYLNEDFTNDYDIVGVIQDVYTRNYGNLGTQYELHKSEVLSLFHSEYYGVLNYNLNGEEIETKFNL